MQQKYVPGAKSRNAPKNGIYLFNAVLIKENPRKRFHSIFNTHLHQFIVLLYQELAVSGRLLDYKFHKPS